MPSFCAPLDGRVIGAGKRSPITAKIQKKFFEVVNGKVKKHKAWAANVADKKSTSKKCAAVKSTSGEKKA